MDCLSVIYTLEMKVERRVSSRRNSPFSWISKCNMSPHCRWSWLAMESSPGTAALAESPPPARCACRCGIRAKIQCPPPYVGWGMFCHRQS